MGGGALTAIGCSQSNQPLTLAHFDLEPHFKSLDDIIDQSADWLSHHCDDVVFFSLFLTSPELSSHRSGLRRVSLV